MIFFIDLIYEKYAIYGLNLLMFFCEIRKTYEEKHIGNFGFFAFCETDFSLRAAL